MEGCTDGTFQMTGHKFFDCQYGRGLYFPLTSLKPDERFTDPGTVPGAAAVPNRKCSLCVSLKFLVPYYSCSC